MSYPKTAEEWWEQVGHYREELLDLVLNFHPYYRKHHDFVITAPTAEIACQMVREDICDETKIDPAWLFEQYCIEKNPKLSKLLDEAWFGMPESITVRSLPGFGVLCDLCSEAYLLHEEENDTGDC